MESKKELNASDKPASYWSKKYRALLRSRSLFLVGHIDVTRSDEILNRVEEKFHLKYDELKDHTESQLRSWWYSTLMTTFLDNEKARKRRRKKEKTCNESFWDHQSNNSVAKSPDTISQMDAKLILTSINKFASKNFTELEMSVYELAMIDAMPYSQVAEICKTTENTVKQIVYRNRQKIKKVFDVMSKNK